MTDDLLPISALTNAPPNVQQEVEKRWRYTGTGFGRNERYGWFIVEHIDDYTTKIAWTEKYGTDLQDIFDERVDYAVKHGAEVYEKLSQKIPQRGSGLTLDDLDRKEKAVAYAILDEVRDRTQAVVSYLKAWVRQEISEQQRKNV